jgi:hypothetical protein
MVRPDNAMAPDSMGGIISFLSHAPARHRAMALAGMAIGSALLSVFIGWDVHGVIFFDVPLLPGIYFGLVLGIGVFLWATRSWLKIATVVVLTIVAWVCGVKTAISVSEFITQTVNEIAQTPGRLASTLPSYTFALCGVMGGLVGGIITTIGISAVSKDFRSFNNCARTIIVGTLAGALLELGVGGSYAKLAIHIDSLLPLFLIWQSGVAASIAYGLVRQVEHSRAQA